MMQVPRLESRGGSGDLFRMCRTHCTPSGTGTGLVCTYRSIIMPKPPTSTAKPSFLPLPGCSGAQVLLSEVPRCS